MEERHILTFLLHTLCTHTHTCMLTLVPVCRHTLTLAHKYTHVPSSCTELVERRWAHPSLQQPAEPSKHSRGSLHSGVENVPVFSGTNTDLHGAACFPACPAVYHSHSFAFKGGIMGMYRKGVGAGACDQFPVVSCPPVKVGLDVF